jgi:hypothetical protein
LTGNDPDEQSCWKRWHASTGQPALRHAMSTRLVVLRPVELLVRSPA